MNQTVLMGRLINEPMPMVLYDNKEIVVINVAVNRNFKNENGEYDKDIFRIKLYNAIATNTIEHIKKGDLIGVKGRLESNGDRIEIIAERITFLSSNRG